MEKNYDANIVFIARTMARIAMIAWKLGVSGATEKETAEICGQFVREELKKWQEELKNN